MNARRQPSFKKAVELSLDEALIEDAASLGLNISDAVETALRQAVSSEKARRWLEENRAAIEENNARIEKEGLWCDDYRLF